MRPDEIATWVPEVSEDQKQQTAADLARLQSSVGVVDDVLEWMQAAIAIYSSVDGLDIDEATDELAIKNMIVMQKKMKAQFEFKLQEFATKYAEYIQGGVPKL